MSDRPEMLEFRQRASSYVLRRAEGGSVEVLVMLHRDHPEAGTRVPGGGARPHQTPAQTAVRETAEESGVRGLSFGEAVGSLLMRGPQVPGGFQVDTCCWLATGDDRDAWEPVVAGDDGLRMALEFRPADGAGIDWQMDRFLPLAVERFTGQPPRSGRLGPEGEESECAQDRDRARAAVQRPGRPAGGLHAGAGEISSAGRRRPDPDATAR